MISPSSTYTGIVRSVVSKTVNIKYSLHNNHAAPQHYTRPFGRGMPCAVPFSEALCVTTFDIEPLRTCFSTELVFTVVLRIRPSCITASVTRSSPFAVKEPSKGRSGDGGLTLCCAAISTSESVKSKTEWIDRTSESRSRHTYQHGLFPDCHHGTNVIVSVRSICHDVKKWHHFRVV